MTPSSFESTATSVGSAAFQFIIILIIIIIVAVAVVVVIVVIVVTIIIIVIIVIIIIIIINFCKIEKLFRKSTLQHSNILRLPQYCNICNIGSSQQLQHFERSAR